MYLSNKHLYSNTVLINSYSNSVQINVVILIAWRYLIIYGHIPLKYIFHI